MRWHDEVREVRLGGDSPGDRFVFPDDACRPEVAKQFELRGARSIGPPVGEVDDLALRWTVNRTVGLVDEALKFCECQWYRRACRLSPFMPCWTTVHLPSSVTKKPCR